jgi:ATP-dependent Zn protease
MQLLEVLQEQRMRAKELLSQHRDKVEALAQELMRKKVMMLGWHALGAKIQSCSHLNEQV